MINSIRRTITSSLTISLLAVLLMIAFSSAGADESGGPKWIAAKRGKTTQWIWPDGVHAIGKRTHVSEGQRKFRHVFDVRDPGAAKSVVPPGWRPNW
jgi:hypothetical protein